MPLAVCLFISLNVPLGIMGLGLFAVGTMLGIFDVVVKPMLQPYLSALPISVDATTNINEYLTGPSIACTCMGGVLCVLSVMTCLAFCGKRKTTSLCFIVFYDFFIGIVLLLMIALIIIAAQAQSLVGAQMSSYLYTTLTTVYVAVDSLEPVNLLWNVAQIGLNCCGVVNGGDYDQAVTFNRTWLTMASTTTGQIMSMAIPPSCCNSAFLLAASQSSSASMKSAYLMADCVFYLTDTASNYKYGCMNAFWTQYNTFVWYILGPSIVIVLLLLFLFIVPIVVICKNRKSLLGGDDESETKAECSNQQNRWQSGTISAGKQRLNEDEDNGLRGGHYLY